MSHANANAKNKKGPKSTVTDEERNALAILMPQDMWLYEYAKRLFEAKWEFYKTGEAFKAPELPALPEISCSSTRFTLNCTSGPFAGNFQSPAAENDRFKYGGVPMSDDGTCMHAIREGKAPQSLEDKYNLKVSSSWHLVKLGLS